jgi:hypothetical protein
MMQFRHRDRSPPSSSLLTSTRIVFSNWKYLSLTVVIAVAFWVFFALSDQLLFFYPFLTFYWPLPSSSIVPFALSTIIACLIGVVVSMNLHVYVSIRNSVSRKKDEEEEKEQEKKNTLTLDGSTSSSHQRHPFSSILLSGSSLGIISGTCAGCSYPIGSLFASSILGGSSGMVMGASLFSFLSTYQIPLQLISIVLLAWSYYNCASKTLIAANATTRGNCALDDKDDDIGTNKTSAANDPSY